MTSTPGKSLCSLASITFCMAVTATADRAVSSGPVVGWGPIPSAVSGIGGTATDIAVGASHSCAIQAGKGSVVCWGNDSFGQSTPPDAVNGTGGTATGISAGALQSLAIIAVPEPPAWAAHLAALGALALLRRSLPRSGRLLS